ncbi:MAG: hypothetical protein M9955_15700 [Rhizobiaceae bacterium]|nr:hypothetical protein [Rhizobiaceae bacterium]
MHSRVVLEAQQHFRPIDITNLGVFPQAGDEALTEDWLGTLRYRGLAVVKDGANNVVVSPGRAYIGFRQFALEAVETKSLAEEKPLISGQKRVVILAAQGQPDVPAPGVTRFATVSVPNGEGGSVKQTTTQTTAPYVSNKIAVAKIAGAPSTQEQDPSVPADNVPFARIVLDIDGIVTVQQLTAHRINTQTELDALVAQLRSQLENIGGEVAALRTDLVSLQKNQRGNASQATMDALIYDVATLKDVNAIGDAGAPYALDRFENADEVNTAHPDFAGRVDEGFQLPYAAEDKVAVALFNANDTRLMHQNAGLLFPAYDAVIGHVLHSTGQTAPLGGSVTQEMELTKMTMTRVRVRRGTYWHYLHPLLYNRLRSDADIVYRVFRKVGEALAFPYGYYVDRYRWWNRFFRRRVIIDRVTESYDVWQKTPVTIQGVIKSQTWQQGQQRFVPAIRLPLSSWDAGASITVAACKTKANGEPDPTQVLQTVTVTAAAFKKYTPGDVETMTRFAFPVPFFADRGPIAYLTSVMGNVTVHMATGDRFLGGNFFESTDGVFFTGSITQDMAHAVEYCRFRQTVMDVRLNNLSLSGGIQGADFILPGIFPDTTATELQAFSGGSWKTMGQLPADENMVETDDDEIFGNGTTATYDSRAMLHGTEWVMPVLDLGNSERTVFRVATSNHYVSEVHQVPAGPTWAKVVASAKVAGYNADRHTFTPYVKHGAALGSTKNADGAPTVEPIPGTNSARLTWEFTADPDGNQYEVHIPGVTDNIAFPFSHSEVFAKVVQ